MMPPATAVTDTEAKQERTRGHHDCFTLFSNKALLVSLICSVYIWNTWSQVNTTPATPHTVSELQAVKLL